MDVSKLNLNKTIGLRCNQVLFQKGRVPGEHAASIPELLEMLKVLKVSLLDSADWVPVEIQKL